jgi:hypothetical protein
VRTQFAIAVDAGLKVGLGTSSLPICGCRSTGMVAASAAVHADAATGHAAPRLRCGARFATLGVRRLIGIRTRTPLAPIMSVSREAVPCGLAGDAEHLSDNSPGYLALSQNSDGVVQSGSSILEYGGFDLQPAKESFG